MTTVHWQDIVGKDFLPRFTDMVKAEQYLSHKGLAWSTMADKFGLDDLQKYSEKRSIMRRHGWFKSYFEDGELRFMSIHPDRKYISLSQYLTARDAQRIADDEEEYYSTRDYAKVAMPKPRKDIDGEDEEFVKEA